MSVNDRVVFYATDSKLGMLSVDCAVTGRKLFNDIRV